MKLCTQKVSPTLMRPNILEMQNIFAVAGFCSMEACIVQSMQAIRAMLQCIKRVRTVHMLI